MTLAEESADISFVFLGEFGVVVFSGGTNFTDEVANDAERQAGAGDSFTFLHRFKKSNPQERFEMMQSKGALRLLLTGSCRVKSA
jgi:hypothetical protein